jgi:hypothetical protein
VILGDDDGVGVYPECPTESMAEAHLANVCLDRSPTRKGRRAVPARRPEASSPRTRVSGRVGVRPYSDHRFGPSFATVRVNLIGELSFEARNVEILDDQWWEVAAISWPSLEITPIDLIHDDAPPCAGVLP